MTDIFDKQKRSEIMSKVKSRNTSPELKLRKALFKEGLRGYRVNPKLPGSPDIVFTKLKIAIFVDGCFWHGCPKCYSLPKENVEYWREKLDKNRKRDVKVNQLLVEEGWEVIRFWEHEITKNLDEVIKTISSLINNKAIQ